MPSLYRVIKNNSVAEKHEKIIETNYEDIRESAVNQGNVRTFMESYESLSKSILENARRESREILFKAYEEADNTVRNADIKAEEAYKEAYNKGYAEGKENGYKDAYEEAYKKNIDAANIEVERMKKNAENILFQGRKEYDEYLASRENEIRDMIIEICKGVLKREVKDTDGLNTIVLNAISEIKGSRSLIIKCHPDRTASINKVIDEWKKQLAFNGDLFVLEDISVGEDNVVIEKENGKIVTGIDAALNTIKEIVYSKPAGDY